MSIVLQGSTSGSITLQEPAVAGSTVLSLPARTSTILGDDGAGKVRKVDMPSGTVLQVVQAVTTSAITTTSSSYQASGLIASITPTSATSRILVMVNGGGSYNSASNVGGDNKLYRQIASGGYSALGGNEVDWCGAQSATASIVIQHSYAFLDSPATTSTVSYQPYYRVNPVGAGGTYHFNVNYYSNMIGRISLTLMEIAA